MTPYKAQPEKAFWKPAAAARNPLEIQDIWSPKFEISRSHKIATAGSCFAQRIGRALSAEGFAWMDYEPAPELVQDTELARRFNFGVFSFRTGNIYTARQLLQWVSWAFGAATPPDEIWEQEGRFYDPFRPKIEPGGFASRAELERARAATFAAIRRAISDLDLLVFTLGLTEAWSHSDHGQQYPSCPGAIAGTFDPDLHVLENLRCGQITSDLERAFGIMRAENPQLKILLTVSPVPMTATATAEHIMVANIRSKSTLRSAAGELAELPFVDYFPGYELITGSPFRSMFYEPNLREVSAAGVAFVLRHFLAAVAPGEASQTKPHDPASAGPPDWAAEAAECDEVGLELAYTSR